MSQLNGPRMVAIGLTAVSVVAVAACSSGGGGGAGNLKIGLVTKTDTNPFYVAMKEAALDEAKKLGVDLQTFSGKVNNDNDSQVSAVENLIASNANGILITPADSAAIVPTLEKARKAGITVIALDTPTQPPDAVDATFATDNFKAGEYIGQWAAAKMAGRPARIALLDQDANNTSVDVARNQGFLTGFGIPTADPKKNGDENDPRIVGNFATESERDQGRTAMEQALQRDPNLNVVYSINEVVAAGAHEAIKAANRQNDIVMVSVDGGCPGVAAIKDGTLGATAMQFPRKMAVEGMDAIVKASKDKQPPTEKNVDTGATLITNDPLAGVQSEDTAWGEQNCWG